MLDDSTTALAVARLLPGRSPLTVITNFLTGINLLASEPGVDLIALGGAYYPAYDAFLGLRTTEGIRSLRAEILFMSTTAVTNGYCYHQSQETVAVKRALMGAADRRFLLLDHSKFEKSGLHQLAPLTAFDLVIVDSATPPDALAALRAQGVKLLVADGSTQSTVTSRVIDEPIRMHEKGKVDKPVARPTSIAVITSGGDAAGMNAALRSVVRTALHHGLEVYAVAEGYRGLVEGDGAIRRLESADVGGILQRGGTVIGTARSADFRTREGRRRPRRT